MKKTYLILSFLLLSVLLFGQTYGGPDAYGYKWIDSNDANGPVYNWITPDTTNGNIVTGFTDDSLVGPFPIGFNFDFYGQTKTEFYLCSNGFISFANDDDQHLDHPIPDPQVPNDMICWFWDDMNPTVSGTTVYENITHNGMNALLLSMINYHEFNAPGAITAQVILKENGQIIMQYDEFINGLDLTDYTIGIENANGSIALMHSHHDTTATALTEDMAIFYYTVDPGYPEFAVHANPEAGSFGVPVNGNLNWHFGADTETYDLWFGPAGNMTQVVTGAAAGDSATYAYSNLNTISTYEWRVDTYNSATRLATTGPVWSFETECGTITTFPWAEDFEGAALPSCWTDDSTNVTPWSYGASTSSSDTGPQSGDHTSGSGYFVYTEASGHTNQTFKMVTPVINASSLSNPVFSFWYHMYGQTMGTLNVNLIEVQSGIIHNDIIGQISGDHGDTWINASFDLSSFTDDFKVEFVGVTGSDYYSDICIDDVSVYDNSIPPTCCTGFSPADQDTAVLEYGSLSWTASLGATGYYVYLGTDNPPTNVYDGVDNGALSTISYSNLSYDTVYYWYVIPFNSIGSASGCTVNSFTTRQDPSIVSYPWTEDFTNWPPLDFSFSGDRSWASHAGSGSAYCNFWSWDGGVAQMALPPFNIPAAGNFYMSFDWSHHFNPTYIGDSLAVLVSVDGINWDIGWTRVDEIFESNDTAGNTTPGTFIRSSVTLRPYLGQTVFIKFYARSGYGPDLYIDNITIEDVTATTVCCQNNIPVQDSTGVLETGYLSWDDALYADGYKLFLGTDNPPTDVLNGQDLGVSFSYQFDLNYSTDYYWQVVPYNTSGDAAGCPIWHFTTRDDPTVSTFPYIQSMSDNNLPDYWVNNEYDSDDWNTLTTVEYGPDVDNTGDGGSFLAFDDSGTGVDSALIISPDIDVSTLTSPTLSFSYWIGNTANSTEPQSTLYIDVKQNGVWHRDLISLSHSPSWGAVSLDLTPYMSALFQIRLRAIGSASYYSDIGIDDITIYDLVNPPVCSNAINPANGRTDVVETGSLVWSPAMGATAYKINLGTDNPPTNIQSNLDVGNATSYAFTLSRNTTYYWQVIPYNANGDATGCPVWNFTTRGDPAVVSYPYTADLEDNMIPTWWTPDTTASTLWEIHSGTTTSSNTGPSGDHTTGTGYYLYVEASSHSNEEAIIDTRPFDFTNNPYPVLSFWYHMYGETMGTLSVDIYNQTSDSWSNDLFSITGDQGDQWFEQQIDLTAFSGNTVIVRFRGLVGDSYYSDICIDDVSMLNLVPPDHDLSVNRLIGDVEAMVGSPSNYSVTLRNNGLNSENNYTVKLYLPANTELASVTDTVTIAPGDTTVVNLQWIPVAGMEGDRDIYAKVFLNNDARPENDVSDMYSVTVLQSITGIQGYVRDINGQPLEGAQILNDNLSSVEYTNASGFYQFLGIAPGTYTCIASLNNYNSDTVDNIDVQMNILTNVDFVLSQGATLSGSVYDQNSNPVPGATVRIDALNEETLTNDQGAYQMVMLTPGTYDVTTSKPGFMTRVDSNIVVSANVVTPLDVVINEYGHITVNVTTNLNSPAGASVQLTDGTNNYQDIADETGVVVFNEVISGTYTLTGALEGCTPFEQTNLAIAAGDNTPIDVTLNEMLIAPTNVRWDNDNHMLLWDHGDRIYGTRSNGDAALLQGEEITDKDAVKKTEDRGLRYFRVQVDMLDETTDSTFFVVSGFSAGDNLTAIITAVYETGNAQAPGHPFTFGVPNDDKDAVTVTELQGNYPNPFNPTTNIKFSLKKAGKVELIVYNINGQKVKTLLDGDLPADRYNIEWNGRDEHGKSVSSGTYLYILKTEDYTKTKKMIMLK